MESEEFCLRWNNHHNVLVTVLDKLLEKESLVDVTLASEGQFLRVHRLVLCACSQYFEEILSYQSDKHAIIFLKDVKFVDLKALVDYMYKGEVNVAQDQLSSFLNTAEALNVKGLAYKEDVDQPTPPSKSRSSNSHSNVKQSQKKTNESPLKDPAIPVIQMPEGSPIPNLTPSETVKTKNAVQSQSISEIPLNDTAESEENFVPIDPKVESEMDTDTNEDRSDGKYPNWTTRDCEDDWSTSDPGLVVLPNSDPSIQIPTFPTGELWSSTDNNVAGPSAGARPKIVVSSVANNSSSSTTPARTGKKVAGERFPCPNCQRTYKNKPHLYRHLRSGCGIRKAEAGIDDSHLPVFHCIDPNCGYQTYVRGFLVRHIQIAHGRRT